LGFAPGDSSRYDAHSTVVSELQEPVIQQANGSVQGSGRLPLQVLQGGILA